MNRLLIVAADYRRALGYAKEHDLGHPGERWRYVPSLAYTKYGCGPEDRYVDLGGDQEVVEILRSRGVQKA